MAAGLTYEPIATLTGTGSSGTFTFSSIPSTYTDLIISIKAIGTTNDFGIYGKVNNDSSSLYSSTLIIGRNTAVATQRETGLTQYIYGGWTIGAGTTTVSQLTIQYLNYSNTTTFKTSLSQYGVRNNAGSTEAGSVTGLYRSTSAINRIDIIAGAGNWATTATATLYGISAA
jgi:hypothetical protein